MKSIASKFALIFVICASVLRAGLYDDALLLSFQVNGDTSDIYNYVVYKPPSGPGIFLFDPTLSNTGNTVGSMIMSSVGSTLTYDPGTETIDVTSGVFASSAQGTKADSALQSAAIGSTVQAFSANLSTFASNGSAFYLNRANHTGTQAASTITGLATVATSGAYADLSGKPSIPAAQVNSDWNAVSGLAQILNKPTLTNGTVTSVIAGTGLSGGTITGTGTISMPNVGTSGTYSNVATDAQGRVSSGTMTTALTAPTFTSATTAAQLSTTQWADSSFSFPTSITTVLGTQVITATLKYADNSGMSTNVVTVSTDQISIGGVLSLAVSNMLRVGGKTPPGKYRQVTFTTSGGATAPSTLSAGQETAI